MIVTAEGGESGWFRNCTITSSFVGLAVSAATRPTNFNVTFPGGRYAVISQTLAAFEHHQVVKLTGSHGALWSIRFSIE